jgi:death-on-curing family protein
VSRKTIRVGELAREADVDLDEALVTLWDAGIDQLGSANDLIPARQVAAARSALGLVGPREQLNVQYWIDASGLTLSELSERMRSVGVKLDPSTRRIPKNSLRRFRRAFSEDGVRQAPLPEVRRSTPPLVDNFELRDIGRTAVSKYLSESELVGIHEALEEDFRDSGDPISPPGVKNAALVSMSAHRPLTSIGQTLKYPTAEMAGAALFHSVALNHSFHNGNKRTALVALIAFLDINGLVMTCAQDELFRMTLRVAQHGLVPTSSSDLADREVAELAEWVRKHTRAIDRSDRPLKWIKLKHILRTFDCEFDAAGGVGNRINITRTIPRKGILKRSRSEVLSIQVACAGDGTEAARNTIHEVRRKLQLDPEHDVDSQVFYHGAEIDGFICEYRHILTRLARL